MTVCVICYQYTKSRFKKDILQLQELNGSSSVCGKSFNSASKVVSLPVDTDLVVVK